MKLSELEIGDRGVISSIRASRKLKERFLSFGIARGIELEVAQFSPDRKIIEIVIDNTAIAIRRDEAQTIEVERCAK
jgi:Fe2+ transport system protein FeoA